MLRIPQRLKATAFLLLGFVAVACTSGGFLQPAKSTGQITMTLLGSGATLSQNQTLDITGGFGIQLSETNYNATFTAAITNFTAPTTQACYTVSMDAATGRIATFTPRTATALPTATSSNPCGQPGSDVETVLFEDQQQHTVTLNFANIPATSAPSGMPTGIVASLDGTPNVMPTPPATPYPASNAFVLLVAESGYSGPFTGTITSYTAPVTAPCYMVTMDAATGKIATLVPRASTSLSGQSPSPCIPPNSDVESVVFQDSRGNSSPPYYFTNTGVPPSTAPIITLVGSSSPLMTSLGAPKNIDPSPAPTTPAQLGFAVDVTSTINTGPFTATVVSWTAGTVGPCYMVTGTSPFFTFVPETPAPLVTPTPTLAPSTPTPSPTPAPTASPNPCLVVNGGDVEGILFTDSHGNYSEQFITH